MAFAEVFRLHPWDIERLKLNEFDAYAESINRRIEQAEGR